MAVTVPADAAFIAGLRAALAALAQPERAPAMQAYMKSAMPYLGVAAPLRRRAVAGFIQDRPLADAATLAATVRGLWDQATHREERYAAAELARLGPHRKLASMALLPVYEHMLVSGAWWDHVDDIAGDGLAALWRLDAAALRTAFERWCHSDDLWLRRAAMLGQRKRPARDFDAALFYATLRPNLQGEPGSRFAGEFFIRKGMGWALRERAYQAPDEVRAFCAAHARQLSPLTLREALRRLPPPPPA